MVFPNHSAVLDSALQLKDAGLVAATAVSTVGGSDVTIDLGAAEFAQGRVIIDVSAIEVATGDENYTFAVEGATTSAFSAVNVLASRKLGDATQIAESVDSGTGRYVLHFDNIANVSGEYLPMRYLRLRCTVAGTIATGINYTAWLVRD